MLELQAGRVLANIVLPQVAQTAVANLSDNDKKTLRTWGVFILCLAFSIVGVVLSFVVLGSTITGYRLCRVSLVIATIMLGLSYGAKYANEDARASFTPVDLIQYLSQRFLWPSTWPGLATFLNITPIDDRQEKLLWLRTRSCGR